MDISGKTGTAQVVGRSSDPHLSEKDMPDHFKAHAWFVSYAPSVDPQIAVVVFVEHGEHGSSTAAPIAREIIRTYLEKDEYGRQLKAEISKQ
jgi:penicillin-binding protein 2